MRYISDRKKRVLSIIEVFPAATLKHFIKDVMHFIQTIKVLCHSPEVRTFFLVSFVWKAYNCTSITAMYVFNRYTEVKKTLDDNMHSLRNKTHP